MAYSTGYLTDVSDVITYTSGTYPDALRALSEVWGRTQAQTETLLNARYGAADFAAATNALQDAGVVVAKNPSGYNCYAFESAVTKTFDTAASAVNSNATVTTTVQAAPVIDTTVDTATQTVTAVPATKAVTVGGVTHNLKMFAGSAIQAISAAGLGISLGKTIDSALYNLNPNFWDSVGMSTLNPETWATITNGDDSFAAGLFNTVFGIDTDTGYGQMYLDENAAAYLAYWMAQQGVFAPSETNFTYDSSVAETLRNQVDQPVSVGTSCITDFYRNGVLNSSIIWNVSSSTSPVYFVTVAIPTYGYCVIAISKDQFTLVTNTGLSRSGVNQFGGYSTALTSSETNTITAPPTRGYLIHSPLPAVYSNSGAFTNTSDAIHDITTIILNGTEHQAQQIEGIGNQGTATLPDISTWTDPASTLTSLQTQYPDLWGSAFTNNVVQPDGSVLTKTYIPVATPNTTSMQDTQPTSTEQTQQNPEVQPSSSPNADNANILQTIIKYITQTKPETQTETETEPTQPNYPDTGTGTTDPPLVPTGNASALWSVYHPTQSQVDAFGAWLWGDVGLDLDTLKKILNDPMNGIITLHKVFATPVDSGSGTIVVGRLDSGVSSATVNQQYVYVDCGSVDLNEYFGNVFDYSPHTEVALYLPFIGIVNLNTADVMRGTINVTYGVDVYTGACLAMVTVTRDGNTVNMYQYSGVASVEYPLTGGQHSSLITGLLGVGAGIASGNIPAILGGTAAALKTSQSRAGSFSGNAGAMGIKIPYLIISRPQTKVAGTFPQLQGYPTNTSVKLGACSGQVRVRAVHVEGINATETELGEIENLLLSGVLI